MEVPPLERKLVAILAADVEGYSRLMHQDEERTLATLTSHRAIVDDLISVCRGEISGAAGDSVLAQFASVVDAVNCGVAIQQALSKANNALELERRMEFRIGINVGDVMVKDGGIFGDGVNVAARLEGLADPGSICITRGVRDQIRDRTAYKFQDLGEHVVKNIARPVRVFRVLFDIEGAIALSPATSSKTHDRSRIAFRASASEAELAFWNSVETSDLDEEYRAYLAKYPDGEFVSLAKARLNRAGDAEAVVDPAIELAFWNSVLASGKRAMYEAYLQKFPNGEFRQLAEIELSSTSDQAQSGAS